MNYKKEEVQDLILQRVPQDASTIGNQALLAALQQQLPDLSEEDYFSIRDQLVAEGVLGKGRGRGGSVYLIDTVDPDEKDVDDDSEDDDEEQEDEDFELLSPEASPVAASRNPRAKRKACKNAGELKQVLSYRHQDMRANNPEVGMVHPENDPDVPKTQWIYDPHIDPALQFDVGRAKIEALIDDALGSGQPEAMREALEELKRLQGPYLNWAGKAERTSFEVDNVSLHVHERVDPATILANVRKRLKKGEKTEDMLRQPDLFEAPFESLPLRQALDFYKHEKNWSNRLIAGDSLLVMNSLLQKESMAGQVQMIYIDPPYGIKYGSNFQPFTNKRDVKDGADADLTQEPEMIKAFRDTWELGIHSYLTYLRDRLLLAKELLSESGSVFVQISDENLHHTRELMEEVFGFENFVSIISFVKTAGQSDSRLAGVSDYLVWFAKRTSCLKYNQIYLTKVLGGGGASGYNRIEETNGVKRSISKSDDLDKLLSGGCRVFTSQSVESQSPGTKYPVEFMGFTISPNGYWKTQESSMPKLLKSGRLMLSGSTLRYLRYFNDFPAFPLVNLWQDTGVAGFASDKRYVVETSAKVIERCLLMATDPGDLVLDPTCGSGTTAFVAEKWGRRWITCDTSRVAITLAKQRLMTASFDYYVLRYPHEGLKGGFMYKTVPHVTLKSIANNPDIDAIYDRMHPAIEAALADLNAALKASPPAPLRPAHGYRKGKPVDFSRAETLEEWEVPFDWPEGGTNGARAPFDAFHQARQAMQRQMDDSIAAHAEHETLYDQPEIDKNRLRITGPFSVEAVPSPTVRSLDAVDPPAQADTSVARTGETSRQALWRDELMKTGIRGKGGQMMRFAELEAIPGLKHLHASGSLSETGERVVVSFGPEHAALEQRQVELALDEAEKLRPAPHYIVFCAFTFDPEAAKDIDEVNWPGATLLKAQMNTDLLTEDLKRARSSNESFWLMGQPDVELRRREDGQWEVEVHGFDYFDPGKGELVSGGKKKIAMWSLDTDYDNRSLMPHQVFFPMAGAKDGWNRLKKTVRAELDEDLFESFHGTVSLPFEAGENRRVAVKIVDDRGIESLKIIAL